MKRFAQWFTTSRRQGIQLFATSLIPLLVLFGMGTEEYFTHWTIVLAAVMQFVTSLLSLLNLRQGDWGAAWAIIRGAVYTLGLTVAPTFALLGFWTEEFGGLILTGVSLTLTVLSNVVAVLVSGEQKLEDEQWERQHVPRHASSEVLPDER